MKNNIPHLVTVLGLFFILISGTVDLNNLFNYENQETPSYVTKDNTPESNVIDNKIATLGRVLFYDKNLSSNNTIACASCHQQAFAFSDPLTASIGLNGESTNRHSMRLINSRFSNEERFFWDERAISLENQVTQPIKDHIEMGYSGADGDPNFNDLITKLSAISYYETLFEFAYGTPLIDEVRIQKALAQFVRSIQSFDSKFDSGLLEVQNINQPFPNFTTLENQGKQLFLSPPINGGAGCAGCHVPPEFDIDPITLNNGVIGVIGNPLELDLTNTRAPSLRDIVNPDGSLNGPLMHDGSLTTLLQVINHYNAIPNQAANTNLDNRLNPPGPGLQILGLTDNEKDALQAFLKTLTGSAVYTNEIWSNPFDDQGNISIVGDQLSSKEEIFGKSVTLFPNPAITVISVGIISGNYQVEIYDMKGQLVDQKSIVGDDRINLESLPKAIYIIKIKDFETHKTYEQKIIKR